MPTAAPDFLSFDLAAEFRKVIFQNKFCYMFYNFSRYLR